MPASRWQGFTSLWLVFFARETLAYLSGETPKFRALEFYCMIWVYLNRSIKQNSSP